MRNSKSKKYKIIIIVVNRTTEADARNFQRITYLGNCTALRNLTTKTKRAPRGAEGVAD